MARFKVIDQDNFEPIQGEVLPFGEGEVDLVEREGYRTTEEIVTEMIQAGIRLQAFRRGEFDIEEEEDFENVDQMNPTTRPGFDAADATMMMDGVVARLSVLEEAERERKAKEEAVKEEAPKAEGK